MLERYLLSTLASKFGHVFEDFDEHTKAELSAWRGVLVLRNLHLRKDALKNLGVPLAGGDEGGDEEGDEDGDEFDEYDEYDDDSDCNDVVNDVIEGGIGLSRETVSMDNEVHREDAADNGDDDSFQSCTSHIDNESQTSDHEDDAICDMDHDIHNGIDKTDDIDCKNDHTQNTNNASSNPKFRAPALEIVHGSIGSLELHIPWGLLRSRVTSDSSTGENDPTEDNNYGDEDDYLACSALLSDVRILVAPSNNSRSQRHSSANQHVQDGQRRIGSQNGPNDGNSSSSSKRKEKRRKQLEKKREQRELAVQSLLEAEIFRRIRGNGRPNGQDSEKTHEGWLARWAKRLVSRIVSSLKVSICNIHIRYEDEGVGWFDDENIRGSRRRQYRPAFAMGLRLESFSIRNATAEDEIEGNDGVNAKFGESGLSASLQVRRKIANVVNLAVYWDSTESNLFVSSKASRTNSENDLLYYGERFEEMDGAGGVGRHRYLIEPLSPSLNVKMVDPKGFDNAASERTAENESSAATEEDDNEKESIASQQTKAALIAPTISATLSIPFCHVGFDRNTLEDIAYLRKCYASRAQRISFLKERLLEERISSHLSQIRPPSDISPLDNPRLWWQYAIGAVRIAHVKEEDVKEVHGPLKKKWRRGGWLGLARLLRLRNQYTSLYESLWEASSDDLDSKQKVHGNLLLLEDDLSYEEIVAFRCAAFAKLSGPSSTHMTDPNPDSPKLKRGKINYPALSVEYREIKLTEGFMALSERFASSEQKDQRASAADVVGGSSCPVWVISVSCGDFSIQAKDPSRTINTLDNTVLKSRGVPIFRMHCSCLSKFQSFQNGSWDVSSALHSLVVYDLISPILDKSGKERTVVASKQRGTSTRTGNKLLKLVSFDEDSNKQFEDHNASIIIRNVVNDKVDINLDTHATTFIEAHVSPLEVIYSTNVAEGLSRLFAAVKTSEFSRDYARLSQVIHRWRSVQRQRLMAVLARKKKFHVSVDIAAPLFVFPQDLQNLDSPTLIVDFGRLTLASDPSEVSSPEFDDNWQLRIANIRALCLQQQQHSEPWEHHIIEPFTLNFSISTHIAESDSTTIIDTTKIKIEASLPRLRFNLASSAVRLVSRLQMRWNEAKARNITNQSDHRAMSFLHQSTSQNTVLNDLSLSKSHSSNQLESRPTTDITFSFIAPLISFRIENDEQMPLHPPTPLIELSIRGIRGKFAAQNSGTGEQSQFSARLKSIHAIDNRSIFCHLMSSVDPELFEGIDDSCDHVPAAANSTFYDEDEDLVVIHSSNKANGDKDVSIHFHELYIEWNPESLASVQKALRLPPNEKSLQSTGSEVAWTVSSDDDTANPSAQESEFFDALETNGETSTFHVAAGFETIYDRPPITIPQSTPAPLLKMTFHLSKLRVNFNKDSQKRCLFVAEMNQTKIDYCRKPLGGSIISSVVADARLTDPDGTTGRTLYGQIIGLQSTASNSIVQMSFETFPSNNHDSQERGYDNLMNLRFSEMRFVFINQLWLEIFDYAFEGILGHAVWGSKAKVLPPVTDEVVKTRSFRVTKFDIHMEQPLLVLPVCYRSPQHVRLILKAFEASNFFSNQTMVGKEGQPKKWTQWFNNCQLTLRDLDIRSWEERKLNEIPLGTKPPSLVLNVRWPVGPSAPLVRPKWNVHGKFDPLVMSFSRKDFALFQFFVSMNLLEPSRFISREISKEKDRHLVLFGYEKTGLPPTTYSMSLKSDSLKFQFVLDEEESDSRKVEGVIDVVCLNASWTLVKSADYISRQKVNVESIKLTQTSKKKEWIGFPNIIEPSPATPNELRCLLQYTSTTLPNGNNAKTLDISSASIYLILPSWEYAWNFFKYLPSSPEIFDTTEMSSIIAVNDRFYRLSKSPGTKCTKEDSLHLANRAKQLTQNTSPKQFLLTLTSPHIILVADSTCRQSKLIALHLAHLNYLKKATIGSTTHSILCDGLEIFTDNGNSSSRSSLISPLSLCGSLRNEWINLPSINQTKGWIWSEDIRAHAKHSDIISAIEVFDGFNNQNKKSKTDNPGKTHGGNRNENDAKNCTHSSTKTEVNPSMSTINMEVVCDGFNLIVVDDSYRHFANAQPLIDATLKDLRFSRVDTLPDNMDGTDNNLIEKNLFVSLGSLDLKDLLQPPNSPFRLLVSSSVVEASEPPNFQKDRDKMSWEMLKMIPDLTSWGFKLSPSMECRENAIHQLRSPDDYFDDSSCRKMQDKLMVFRSVLHPNGLNQIHFKLQNVTGQWNPNCVIALQRFLGRIKKAALHIFPKHSPDSEESVTSSSDPVLQPKITSGSHSSVIFAVDACINSICICLNKEYQQRRLLDTTISGISTNFVRLSDDSIILEGSLDSLRAWDPDTKPTSERNRLVLCSSASTDEHQGHFFSFQFRTFRSEIGIATDLPNWVNQKSSGTLDDFLSIKLSPLEFNYLRERTAELADYLNNGLPGKGMGATTQAAQSFCASRIKTRSYLDCSIEQPRVFIPRSASSITGGCYVSLSNVVMTSWFEEAKAHTGEESQHVECMDWWRVLKLDFSLGMKTEVTQFNSSDTLFDINVLVRKPMFGSTTVVRGNMAPSNIHLKYSDYQMLQVISAENIGKTIDESKWENIEKSYSVHGDEPITDGSSEVETNDRAASSLTYAKSARFVRFGESKGATKNGLDVEFSIRSISVTLHRDDFDDQEDKGKAALLCYDICSLSVDKLELGMQVGSNGDTAISFCLYEMNFTDLGDYGRLAREIYMEGNEGTRPPTAFTSVAKSYGQSTGDPLVSINFEKKGETRCTELKVNSLSLTVLPRPLEDLIGFFSSKWTCPNLNIQLQRQATNPSTDKMKTKIGSHRFKFIAVNPQCILLADETDPYSRALVLRGLVVANVNIENEEVSKLPIQGVHDIRQCLNGTLHLKHLETLVHHNIDDLIGPSKIDKASNSTISDEIIRNESMGTSLIEPVTVTVEFSTVERSRFPKSKFLSVEIDPVATLFSFEDLNVIETVLRKWKKKPPENMIPNHESDMKSEFEVIQMNAPMTPLAHKQNVFFESDQANGKEFFTFDVAIASQKLGLGLRKSGFLTVVDRSYNHHSVHIGDILASINGKSISSMPLPSIVDLLDTTPRPVVLTFERRSTLPSSQHSEMSIYQSHLTEAYTSSKSFSFDVNFDEAGIISNASNVSGYSQVSRNEKGFRYSLRCQCGFANGLGLESGIGGTAVVVSVDYVLLQQCVYSDDAKPEEGDRFLYPSFSSDISRLEKLPLPGAVLLSINEKKVLYEEAVSVFASSECSTAENKFYTLVFLESDSSSWGGISNFLMSFSLSLTIVDDTNGRDMPVLRAGILDTNLVANHGLAIGTKTIDARSPAILSLEGGTKSSNNGMKPSPTNDMVLTVESEIKNINIEYYNAQIGLWEPLLEPHGVRSVIERQGGNQIQAGKCSLLVTDNVGSDITCPASFFCVNVSDAAVDILSKAAMNWKNWKKMKRKAQHGNQSCTENPKNAASDQNSEPHIPVTFSSAAELQRATKLAKLALDLSRKRGSSNPDTNRSPFILRNKTGLKISMSAAGISSIEAYDDQDVQFEMTPLTNNVNYRPNPKPHGTRLRKYDGVFPKVTIKLEFDSISGSRNAKHDFDAAVSDIISAEIRNLGCSKVGRVVRAVRVRRKSDTHSSTFLNVIWSVELEENRRVLTLSSATSVKIFGCGPAMEIGVRFPQSEEENSPNEIKPIGITSNRIYHLPLWIGFCRAAIFVRPDHPNKKMDETESNLNGHCGLYQWSSYPVLELCEEVVDREYLSDDERESNDSIQVQYVWKTEINLLGGVHCAVKGEDQSHIRPIWMPCSTNRDAWHVGDSMNNEISVTIWSAVTIRNMLPCDIEWEVANDAGSIIDSSTIRKEQNLQYGMSPMSSPETANDDTSFVLKCGAAVEVFSTDSLDRLLRARIKCVARERSLWSEWLAIDLSENRNTKERNAKCEDPSGSQSMSIGIKLCPRVDAGKGVNLIIFAEVWLRNLTNLPLTFGAPSTQLRTKGDIDMVAMTGKISAESALVEITSVLDGNGFSLFGDADDDVDDYCSDNAILPLQQTWDDVFEEVFEYIQLNEKGDIDRRWWASEDYVSLRPEPTLTDTNDEYSWHVDCAAYPFLENGWESCVNVTGSKSCTFNGERRFARNHRFRRRRWYRKVKKDEKTHLSNAIIDGVLFHQPADLDGSTRARREAERNVIGVHLDEEKQNGDSLLDLLNLPQQQDGILDIMTAVANDGSIFLHVKYKDGKWSTPLIIPPSGNSCGVIRAFSSRWPLVTRAMKQHKRKGAPVSPTSNGARLGVSSHSKNLGVAPLDPSAFELCYQVSTLSGLWGELSRMITLTPRFLIRNESSWLDIDIKQVGAPDGSRIFLSRGEILPFYWVDFTLPELVCARPSATEETCGKGENVTESRSGFKWSGGFDVCTLGMLPLRVRRIEYNSQSKLWSLRVNVEIQPGTGGAGTIISLRDEDPHGEGSLFRIENHSPFQIFISQDGVLANPATQRDHGSSCDLIEPGERTSYALDVPWRQGKYEGRMSASISELLLLRCALAPLWTREGVESTKVICFDRVGDIIRLSPSKLTTTLGSFVSSELLGVRILGVIGLDGPTRVLRFVLMRKDVTPSSFLGNAMRDSIYPMPSFLEVTDDAATHHHDEQNRQKVALSAATHTSCLLNTGKILVESEATKDAFFGSGICARPNVLKSKESSLNDHSSNYGDKISCELAFNGFIFSFIDSTPSELAVLSLHNVKASSTWNSQGKEYAKCAVSVGWFQLDNHTPNAPFPVAICPIGEKDIDSEKLLTPDSSKMFSLDKPFLELKIDLAPQHRTGIQCLSAGAAIRNVSLFFDLAFLVRVQRFVLGIQDHIMDATGNNSADSKEKWEIPNIEQLIKKKTMIGSDMGQKALYFKNLTILPCKVKLSVAPVRALTKYQEAFEGIEATAIHTAVRKGDLLVGEGSGVLGVKIGGHNRTALAVVQGMLKSILVDALLRCDGASLNFEGVSLWNHLANTPQLGTYLGAHYLASLISNVPALLGSLAVFGNPLGLIRDLGDGVTDFVNEPMKGFKKSIEEMDPSFVMSGVARGTGSLARHTLGGFADSAAMLTETAAKNMAVLTLDRKYAQRRDRVMKLKSNGNPSIIGGFESGMLKLVNGILEGVTGVVSKPMKGAERNGVEGFAKGIGKGLLGLIVKPVIGATDAITDTLIGVKGSVEGANRISVEAAYNQVRPRRALYGDDRVVKPYRLDDASAATIQSRSRLGGENYFSHVDMVDSVCLLSVNRLLILSQDGKEMVLLTFSEIKRVEVQPQIDSGYMVTIFLRHPNADGKDMEVVKCEEEQKARKLCEELSKVI